MHSPELTDRRRHASRHAFTDLPARPADPAGVQDALDADLLGLVAAAGGDATLRELFQRDATWADPAPLWATAAALRCVRAGRLTCHGRAAVLTLTPAGYELARAAGSAA